MNIKIKLNDFKSICRFCLIKEPHMKQIFSSDDEDENDDTNEYSISEMIEFCLGIKILADDKLPKFLCKNCYKKLLNCNKFHKKCLSAEETLNNMLKQYDKQNKYESSIFPITTPLKRDPLDYSCTEHAEEICSINEPTIDIKEENVYEWTGTGNNHNEECEEILTDETNIRDVDNFENNYADNKNEKDEPAEDNGITLNCTNDEKINKGKRIRKRDQCSICGKLVTVLSSHMETHFDIKKHKCPHCDKTFQNKCNLDEHINCHFDLRPHKCKYCDKSFNSRKCLKIHNIWHSKEERYECNICERKFLYESSYRNHMRGHNQIRKYNCDICIRTFITKHELKRHYRVHTGERPYKCNECDKCFGQSGALKSHRKVHTKQISHYCNKCNVGFVYKSTLNSHLKKCQ